MLVEIWQGSPYAIALDLHVALLVIAICEGSPSGHPYYLIPEVCFHFYINLITIL